MSGEFKMGLGIATASQALGGLGIVVSSLLDGPPLTVSALVGGSALFALVSVLTSGALGLAAFVCYGNRVNGFHIAAGAVTAAAVFSAADAAAYFYTQYAEPVAVITAPIVPNHRALRLTQKSPPPVLVVRG